MVMEMKKYSRFKDFILPIVQRYRLVGFRKKWRAINAHNDTIPCNVFPINKVSVGNYTYGTLNVKTYGNLDSALEIGSFCSISENVFFILDGEHDYKRFSTFPFSNAVFHDGVDSLSKGKIVVEDDVWIGFGVTILSGVRIGQGSVIGAGSIVSKDIPPYCIFANGKVIKKRFEERIIDELIKIDFNQLDDKQLERLHYFCNNELSNDNVDEFLRIIQHI